MTIHFQLKFCEKGIQNFLAV